MDPLIYTFPPFKLALHDVNEREEKERVEIERVSPTLIYNAPPFDVAEHDSNDREEREYCCPDVRVNESAPPLPCIDEHESNLMLESVTELSDTVVNSNTAPFPLNRVMEVKVVVDVQEMLSTSAEMSGVFVVVVDALDVNVIPFNARVPDDTTINDASSLIVFFTSIVNALNVTVLAPLEAETVKGVPALASV